MAISAPSILASLVDIPQPSEPTARFVYNFFEPNERISGVTDAVFNIGNPLDVLGIPDLDARTLAVTVPRYVQIQFTPTLLNDELAPGPNAFIVGTSPSEIELLIRDNLDKIQSELDISTRQSSALSLQDSHMATAAAAYLELSVSMRADIDGNNVDKAQFLNSVTEDSVSGDIILSLIEDADRQDVMYIDSDSRNELNMSDLASLHAIKVWAQVDDRFVGSIVRSTVANPISPFAGALSSLTSGPAGGTAGEIQSRARNVHESYTINEAEYSAELIPVLAEPTVNSWQPAAKVVAYLIMKEEVFADGSSEFIESLLVMNPNATTATDSNIRYGSVYRYSIRSIALLQLPATSIGDDVPDNYTTVNLVSSRSGPGMIVRCSENIPPPPPADLNFMWDYAERALVIMWEFPVNPQRDIKKFQVFRRPSLSEPFTLLAEYDFDDSAVREARSETPKSSSVIGMSYPEKWYIDEEFTKDSSFIYSLCSIDAHDMSSNYSTQFRVTFDRYKNTLVRELVSLPNAPKPYPNFYLRANLTLDAMKDSNHYTATVYFDPEYLTVMKTVPNSDPVSLELLATIDQEASYKLQFINVDRQKSQVLNIELQDNRSFAAKAGILVHSDGFSENLGMDNQLGIELEPIEF